MFVSVQAHLQYADQVYKCRQYGAWLAQAIWAKIINANICARFRSLWPRNCQALSRAPRSAYTLRSHGEGQPHKGYAHCQKMILTMFLDSGHLFAPPVSLHWKLVSLHFAVAVSVCDLLVSLLDVAFNAETVACHLDT